MRHAYVSALLLAAAGIVLAQNKSSCNAGLYPGTNTVIYTVPYTYPQVLSIIADFRNITWNNIPYDAVSLNGTDNTIGTARTYTTQGATATETILVYEKPAAGPYVLVTAFAPSNVENTSSYGNFNSVIATPVCGGAACTLNFTTDFCSTDVAEAATYFQTVHTADAINVVLFLGGRNFTSCAALVASHSTTAAATSYSTTAAATSSSATGVPFTGSASLRGLNAILVAGAAIAALVGQ